MQPMKHRPDKCGLRRHALCAHVGRGYVARPPFPNPLLFALGPLPSAAAPRCISRALTCGRPPPPSSIARNASACSAALAARLPPRERLAGLCSRASALTCAVACGACGRGSAGRAVVALAGRSAFTGVACTAQSSLGLLGGSWSKRQCREGRRRQGVAVCGSRDCATGADKKAELRSWASCQPIGPHRF